MNIFITGIAGFLGANLADFYVKKDLMLVVVIILLEEI